MRRYKHNMRHQWFPTPTIGELCPILHQEVTPGDTWYGKSFGVFRLSPLDVPTFMTLNVHAKVFFVPHRLTFPEFEEVITGVDTSTAWPTINYSPASGPLEFWSNFGVGYMPTQTTALNAMPVRAWNQIINDHFLDTQHYSARSLDSTSVFRVQFPSFDYYGGATDEIQQGSEITIDTSNPTLGITNVRDALHKQHLLERRSQYGPRYRDLLASYGIRTPDMRLDRAELVATGKTVFGVSEVVTTATSTGEQSGEYRGHGLATMQMNWKPRMFTEHGTLIGCLYVRPRLLIKDRVDRQWLVNDKYDLYHPELANDTQVTVDQQEVYADQAAGDFAYQARDQWLRCARDTVAGTYQFTSDQFIASIEMTAAPSLAYLQQVQAYNSLFQDQTAGRTDIYGFFDHNLRKRSIIPPRRK